MSDQLCCVANTPISRNADEGFEAGSVANEVSETTGVQIPLGRFFDFTSMSDGFAVANTTGIGKGLQGANCETERRKV